MALRLDRALRYLEREGFARAEAIAFVAGIAHQKGVDLGESWTVGDNAQRTIKRVLDGHATKEWCLDAVVLALFEVADMLDLPGVVTNASAQRTPPGAPWGYNPDPDPEEGQ